MSTIVIGGPSATSSTGGSRMPPSSSTPSPPSTSTSNLESFVGNASSTVLFFLALAVGVIIALLFVFFSIRYFIRLKYGLHIYPISHRSIILASPSNMPRPPAQSYFSENDLQDQLAYIREHMFNRGESLERTIQGRRRRRRRRNRYSRMKKLTEDQVELLFPKQTYHKWLNGGQIEDQENRAGVLQEEAVSLGTKIDENSVENEDDENLSGGNGIVEISEDVMEMDDYEDLRPTTTSKKVVKSSSNSIYHPDPDIDSRGQPYTEENGIELCEVGTSSSHTTSNAAKVTPIACETDLHFTSGSCAICLDLLEDDSDVRGLICGHVFHAECLDPWLTRRRACCPMCKRDYFYKDENNNSLNRSTDITEQNREQVNDEEHADQEQNGQDDTTMDNGLTDMDSLDLEVLRNDPTLRAMVQDLVPIQERVRMILRNPDFPAHQIEEEARALANKKFSNVFKKFFWMLMGVSWDNIYNWAVIQIYRKRVSERNANIQAIRPEAQAETETENDAGNQTEAGQVRLTGTSSAEESRDIVEQRV